MPYFGKRIVSTGGEGRALRWLEGSFDCVEGSLDRPPHFSRYATGGRAGIFLSLVLVMIILLGG
jgi:hypothetical protein